MMNTTIQKRWSLVALLLLAGSGAGLVGCVDQEVSMSLEGSVIYEGKVEEETDAEGNVFSFLKCDFGSVKPGSADSFFPRGNLDLSEGAPLHFTAQIINLLEPSNQKTGTQETFPGLSQDQNTIHITKATISYPESLNGAVGGLAESYLAKTELVSGLLTSSGGAFIGSFPLISGREFANARALYEEAVARAGLSAGTQDAIIPLVAEIQIEGETFDGQVVESNVFRFPVNLCKSCELATTPLCEEKN